MDWGLQNRISRIIKPNDNHALMLAVDHGYFLGPTEKLEIPKKTITPILKYCDSLMLTVICSFDKSSPIILEPPETLSTIGTEDFGSTDVLCTPRVRIIESQE